MRHDENAALDSLVLYIQTATSTPFFRYLVDDTGVTPQDANFLVDDTGNTPDDANFLLYE